MATDILIAGLMTLASLAWLAVIIVVIARATRDSPGRKQPIDCAPRASARARLVARAA